MCKESSHSPGTGDKVPYWIRYRDSEDQPRQNVVDMDSSGPGVHTEELRLNYDLQ